MLATLLPVIIVAVSMAIKDTLSTVNVWAISRGKVWTATLFDIGCDWATMISIGTAGAEVYAKGLSWATIYTLAALAIGSYLGTNSGLRVAGLLDVPKKDEDDASSSP